MPFMWYKVLIFPTLDEVLLWNLWVNKVLHLGLAESNYQDKSFLYMMVRSSLRAYLVSLIGKV